jgi:uncharacterized protein YdeI (YjbR/CyaY-like superfamily)
VTGEDRVQPDSVLEWREWLAAHHSRPTGVWLVTWRAGSSGPKIGYEKSVEQPLCFGWIDSKGRALDVERTMLWPAPRKARSGWARTNKQRIERLTAAGLMEPAGLALVEAATADGSWTLVGAPVSGVDGGSLPYAASAWRGDQPALGVA